MRTVKQVLRPERLRQVPEQFSWVDQALVRRHFNPPQIYQTLDGFTRRRLRALLCKRHKRSQFGHSLWASRRWPSRFFAEQGLFTLVQAHTMASQSR
jgi:hypothetical protein